MASSPKLKLVAAPVLVVASTSWAFAIDHAKEQRLEDSRNARSRSDAHFRPLVDRAPTNTGEPFSAAEKRAFQAPTGHEVDRW
jgi:hypothetical protein